MRRIAEVIKTELAAKNALDHRYPGGEGLVHDRAVVTQ